MTSCCPTRATSCNAGPTEIACRVYGTKATIDTDYYTHVWIDGMPENVYKGRLVEARRAVHQRHGGEHPGVPRPILKGD